MKFSNFNPQEIPSRALKEVLFAAQPLTHVTTEFLRQALSIPLERVNFLKRDVDLSSPPRKASVLILLIERAFDFDVVLTVRAVALRHHGGQISFVGGAVDGQETALQTALREAFEEINLDAEDLNIEGYLPIYHTITGFAVTPIVATITAENWSKQKLQVDPQEVDHVFTVPLSVLLNHDLIRVHEYSWQNQVRQFYSVTHGNYFIWGASMAMLLNLDILLRSV